MRAGQAIVSAIAIATPNVDAKPEPDGRLSQTSNLKPQISNLKSQTSTWADFNKDILIKTPDSLLPPRSNNAIEVEGRKVKNRMEWDFTVGVAKVYALRWKYHNAEKPRLLHVHITDSKGTVYKDDDITFLQTQEKKTKRKMTSITTGTQVNAGTYHVVLTGDGLNDMLFDPLTVE